MSDYGQVALPVEAPPHTPFYKRAWFAAVVAGVVGIGIGAAAASGGGDTPDDAEAAAAPTVTVTVEAEGQPVSEEPANEPTSDEPAAEPTSDQPPASTNPVFGDTYAYDDGLSIAITAPAPFEPSEFAAGTIEGQASVKFTVTLVNGTAANFEPATFFATLQSGNSEASQIFDEGLEGSPSTTLLPGREVAFDIGFSVMNAADLVMDVRPSFDYDSVIYTTP